MGDEVQKPKSSEDLRKAVVEAYQLVQEAHAGYHEALAIVADTDHSPDGALAFQQRGREYGYAVRRYSDAVMALLSHTETNRKKALRLLWKHTTADCEESGRRRTRFRDDSERYFRVNPNRIPG